MSVSLDKYFCCCSWTQQFSQSHQNQGGGESLDTPYSPLRFATLAVESWVGSHQSYLMLAIVAPPFLDLSQMSKANLARFSDRVRTDT